MLDSTTKKRIDDCRDILVGKLPDPKSQIEQITIALIYKFMDDMDKEAVELGGTAKFFSGNYAKFAWDALFDAQLGSADMLALYAEAIESMEKNGNIPQLFRDIFKNAYLPYRDPATLKMFLKTIGEFSYGHSEMLGDAFEYLLSIMGSQGDAGQFRTPRHIIDFLVQVVDPKKEDTILDPACGTAGFLISAYKHMLLKNDGKLTPDQRKKLMRNVVGYDISPDMQRLALVNLYLHGFNDPHIFEYDTLSSEERWDETFDVILANPPFMTPKGGIRPHKRFGVQSNRSEVLFVDYIAEHLNTKGRAGIIVPEGVIFQSGTAYKSLRKMLVEDHLYAVVSLPAGVFNPYSGVKTSILLLDREIAKRSNDILFVKIDNDGYNLGAQRAAMKGGQLDDAVALIHQFRDGKFVESEMAHAVVKSAVAESGDYNLSGERYRETRNIDLSDYPHYALGDCCHIMNGSTPSRTNESYWHEGEIPWFTIEDVRMQGRIIRDTAQKITQKALSETSVKLLPAHSVLLCCTASVGEYAYAEIPLATNQQFNGLIIREEFQTKLLSKFLFYLASAFKDELIRISGQTSFNFVSVGVLKTMQIPLPPLSVQEEIVAEIEGYQKIIDGARMVVENYRPQIGIDPEWEMVELGEVCHVTSGGTPDRKNDSYWGGDIPYVKTALIDFGVIDAADEFITEAGLNNSSARIITEGTILMAMYGQGVTRGRVAILGIDAAINQAAAAISVLDENRLDRDFLYYQLQSKYEYLRKISDARGGNQSNLSAGLIKELVLSIPPIEVQRKITLQLIKEQSLVNSNKQLISIFEGKIKERIDRVWGVGKENKEYELIVADN